MNGTVSPYLLFIHHVGPSKHFLKLHCFRLQRSQALQRVVESYKSVKIATTTKQGTYVQVLLLSFAFQVEPTKRNKVSQKDWSRRCLKAYRSFPAECDLHVFQLSYDLVVVVFHLLELCGLEEELKWVEQSSVVYAYTWSSLGWHTMYLSWGLLVLRNCLLVSCIKMTHGLSIWMLNCSMIMATSLREVAIVLLPSWFVVNLLFQWRDGHTVVILNFVITCPASQ